MKTLLVLSLFLSFPAFAGRESHGFAPGGFRCSAEKSPFEADLPVSNQVVVSATLKKNGRAEPELQCVDVWKTRRPQREMESTVFCSSHRSRFLLELQENGAESRLLVWKTDGEERASLVSTLPCQ